MNTGVNCLGGSEKFLWCGKQGLLLWTQSRHLRDLGAPEKAHGVFHQLGPQKT
jgi:hypothetical protein